MTVNNTLVKAVTMLEKHNIDEPILKAKILLSDCLQVPKEFLLINKNENINPEIEEKFFDRIKKICDGIPLQYITNHKEFMGLDFYVDENVLVPRDDTETLVEQVIMSIDKNKKVEILDMCTGSGIIAVTLAKMCNNVTITAIDKSEGALKVALKNAISNDVWSKNESESKTKFIKSDMFENVTGKYDIIVSNPPYIETKTIRSLDKDVQNEPIMALDGGDDGLDFYRIIADNADKFLKEDGKIFVEIGYNQKESVTKIFNTNFTKITCVKDLAGNDRVIICKKF